MRYTDERTYTPSEYVYGYWLAFQSVSTAFGVEIQRSTDDATWTTVVVVYDGKTSYFDEQPMDGVTRYYRGRAVRNGWAPSNWSNSVSGLAVRWLRSEVEDSSVASYAAAVSGTIGVTRGGTGRTSLSTGSLLMGNGSGSVSLLAAGQSGSVLKSDGTRWITGSLLLSDLTGSLPYSKLPTGSGTWITNGTIQLNSSLIVSGTSYFYDYITLNTPYHSAWTFLNSGVSASHQYSGQFFQHDNVARWSIYKDTNASGNFVISRYDDAGTYLGSPIIVSRATGVATFANDIVVQTIRRDTADGSDNGLLSLNGGGAASDNTRGSWVTLVGNDYGGGVGGQIQMVAGNTGSGDIIMYTGATVERMRISNAGPITFSGDIVAQTIRRATSDGSDNSSIGIGGGGAVDMTRGAYIGLYGNEHASIGGGLVLVGGHGTDGNIYFYTSGSERMRIAKNGTTSIYGPMAFGSDLTVDGIITARSTFTSYIADGLFGTTAKPSYILTPNGQAKLILGYDDNGAGQYVPALGFGYHSDNLNKSFKIIQSRAAYGTADSYNRFQVAHDGVMEWGSGASPVDTNLYRYSAGYLATDDVLYLNGGPLYMQATQPVLFDFNTHQHTYIREAANDNLVMVVSGTTIAQFQADGTNGAHGVYLNGWFRNNTSGQGMYNEALGFHWYAEGNTWNARSTSGVRLAQQDATTRGYVGFDSTTFGVKDANNNFSYGIVSDRAYVNSPSGSTSSAFSAAFTPKGITLRSGSNMGEWTASGSARRVLELNLGGAFMADDTGYCYQMANTTWNATTGFRASNNQYPMLQGFENGTWGMWSAGLGTSGSAVTWTQRLFMTNGGNLHVGYTSDQGYKLAVNGNARASAFFTNSALKYKENVVRYDDKEALRILQSTELFTYNMKADEDKTPRVGFIADTAHELLVDKDRDSADIYNALALAIGAIRALSEQNQALEARIAQLEGK